MPELPEAETVKRALAPALEGRTVTKVELFLPALRSPLKPLRKALPGRKILKVFRRARYILAALDNGKFLVIHLGMTGVVRVEDSSVSRRKHEHVHPFSRMSPICSSHTPPPIRNMASAFSTSSFATEGSVLLSITVCLSYAKPCSANISCIPSQSSSFCSKSSGQAVIKTMLFLCVSSVRNLFVISSEK